MNAKTDPDALWFLYLMQCSNDRIYVGISPDPIRRFREHCRRRSANTRMNQPIALLASIPVGCYAEALRVERKVKRLTRTEKLNLAMSMEAEAGF